MTNQASKIPGAPTPNSEPNTPEKKSDPQSSPQKADAPEKLEATAAANQE